MFTKFKNWYRGMIDIQKVIQIAAHARYVAYLPDGRIVTYEHEQAAFHDVGVYGYKKIEKCVVTSVHYF